MNDHRHRPPAAALAGAVTGYLWYRESRTSPRVHRGVPSGTVSIIVSIGPTIDVLDGPDGTEPVRRVARSTPPRTPVAEIAEAWRMIASSHGAAPVSEIARELGWSRQHLARRFRSELGLSPKQAARLVRFGRSRDRLRAGAGRVPLSQVAVECGYYDQSHLTNEWNDLAGCPPAAWCRAEGVPFLQDGAARLEARS